jgi:hypothetical protein
MNGNFDINQAIQSIVQMKSAGQNPQMVMQMMLQRNPQLNQVMAQMKNMAQGRSPQEFIMQLATQNGVSPQNMQALQQLFHK